VEDLELLERWRSGDLQAGDALFERHFDAVHRFFCNKAPADAADLVQRTFLACVEARDRFRQESSLRTFLFAIAHHELLAHFRKRGHAELDPLRSSVCDLDPTPSSLLARAIDERLLLDALRSVPLEFQVAIELYYWEGLSGAELAAVLGIPEGTARSRLRRGLELLRARLDALGREGSAWASTSSSLAGWARQIGDDLRQARD
jgi:RNA polymerase sigma-70 factor (ECF subfamily)